MEIVYIVLAALHAFGIAFLHFYVLWVFYLAVMNLKRVKDTGYQFKKHVLILAYPVLFLGLILDIVINLVFMTIIFLEFPRELLVTSRLKRHNNLGGWRGKIARNFFEPLLDPFDPSGNHI